MYRVKAFWTSTLEEMAVALLWTRRRLPANCCAYSVAARLRPEELKTVSLHIKSHVDEAYLTFVTKFVLVIHYSFLADDLCD